MSIAVDVGSISIDTLEGVKTNSGNAGTGNYDSLEYPIGTKYQVPAEKVLKIGLIIYSGVTVNSKVVIGYGDDSVEDSATPPTNPVELIPILPIETAKKVYNQNLLIEIPAGKYPFIKSVGGEINVITIGIEW